MAALGGGKRSFDASGTRAYHYDLFLVRRFFNRRYGLNAASGV
jgi:hypothetical protein